MILTRSEYPGVGDALYSGTLANGLTIYVVPRPGFRKKHACLSVNYGGAMRDFTLGGARHETPSGTAHFLEHKMFDLPEGNALNILTSRGAEANAWTGADTTAYYFECGEGFYENLELLMKFVSTPYFTPESVEKERGIIGQEISMTEDDPGFALYTEAMGALFARHPLRESVAGTRGSIAAISPDTLYACHKAFYVPSNMCLAVCGDVDPEHAAEAAALCSPPEYVPAAEPDYGEPEALEPAARRAGRSMDISDPMFMAAAKISCGLPRSAEGLRFITAGQLAVQALLGPGSGFYTTLYAEGLLRSDFFRYVSPAAGTLVFACGGTASEPEEVFERLCDALGSAAEDFDAGAFERARRAAYGAGLRGLDSAASLCRELAAGRFGGYNFYESFSALGSVTAGEAQDFVRGYLRPDRLALATVSPKERN